jgi:hypothetical protein
MTFEELQAEWGKDCVIERDQLATASMDTPKLYSKYYKQYIIDRYILKKFEAEMKTLELEKYEFYTQGPTQDQLDRGWKMPPKGVLIKSEVDRYMQADNEIIKMSLKIFGQKQKVEFLEAILNDLTKRTFVIKNAIEYIKIENGIS